MEFPVTVIGDKMQTIDTARTTEIGLTSSRVSILVTVGMRVVVNSSETVDGSGSVAGVDIVIRELRNRSFSLVVASSSKIPFVNVPLVGRHDASDLGRWKYRRAPISSRSFSTSDDPFGRLSADFLKMFENC